VPIPATGNTALRMRSVDMDGPIKPSAGTPNLA
jgi:hypothetical protein